TCSSFVLVKRNGLREHLLISGSLGGGRGRYFGAAAKIAALKVGAPWTGFAQERRANGEPGCAIPKSCTQLESALAQGAIAGGRGWRRKRSRCGRKAHGPSRRRRFWRRRASPDAASLAVRALKSPRASSCGPRPSASTTTPAAGIAWWPRSGTASR